MDFFGAQEQAKRRTFTAVVLFAAGIILTALAVYAALMMALHYQSENWLRAPVDFFDWPIFLWCMIVTSAVILGGTIYKILGLSQGGISVAQSMGVRIIDPNSTDESERRLLNVVEEMAMASGYGIPQVGILDDEPEINAFAAATDKSNAIVVVTRGALEQLSRDELQALIGHEFSHLVNGDSRLNIDLMGWIWGLFILSIIGRMMLNTRGSNRRGGGAIFIFAILLFIIGGIGYFFGRVIQSLVSRQREFLADASSVQFTRNPPSMVTALAKIQSGSQIEHHHADGMAHFFFANASALSADAFGLLSTHPPLEKRMAAIDSNYERLIADMPSISREPTPPQEPS